MTDMDYLCALSKLESSSLDGFAEMQGGRFELFRGNVLINKWVDPQDALSFLMKRSLTKLVGGGVGISDQLWQVFVGTKTRRVQGHYNALLTLLADGGGESNGVGGLLDGNGSTAANLLVCKTGVIEKWTNQIEKVI